MRTTATMIPSSDNVDRICDCSELSGRLLDLCTGEGHDGRPAPRQKAVDHWREQNCRPGSKPPNLLRRAVNFASAATKHILSGRPKATPDQISARLEICKTCDLFDGKYCKECGCACNGSANFMNKLAWADQECPHPAGPKWGKLDGPA